MNATFRAPLYLSLLLLAAEPAWGALPTDLSALGLRDLTRAGELFHLPAHASSPFDAVIVTRSNERCSTLNDALLDVERYPELWPDIHQVRVVERGPTMVRYEIEVALPLAPKLRGVIEHPAPGTLIFHDVETGGRFRYDLHDVAGGCQIRYGLHQPKGRHSGFVEVVTAVDESAADSAELAGALASLRGLTRPDEQPLNVDVRSPEALHAWRQLAAHGTVFKTIHRRGRPLAFVGSRRVATSPDLVVARLRDRAAYPARTPNVRGVSLLADGSVAWRFGFLGGRVDVNTAVHESGDARSDAGLTIVERVVGGDLSEGLWQWTIRAVDGGTEVELFMDLDVARGSRVLRGLSSGHEAIQGAVSMQLFLSLLGRVMRGAPIGDGDHDARASNRRK